MAFCKKCGQELAEGAEFCSSCGTPVEESGVHAARVQNFEGEIRKCPSCGAVLPSMVSKCPECGFELRNVGASASLKKLYEDLKNAKDAQKADIVSLFPIPNSREDIMEFLVMAKGEVAKNIYENRKIGLKYQEAWKAKLSQVKEKASVIFAADKQSQDQINAAVASLKFGKVKLSPVAIIAICAVIAAALVGGTVWTVKKGLPLAKNYRNFRIVKPVAETKTIPQSAARMSGDAALFYEIASDVTLEKHGNSWVRVKFDIKCKEYPLNIWNLYENHSDNGDFVMKGVSFNNMRINGNNTPVVIYRSYKFDNFSAWRDNKDGFVGWHPFIIGILKNLSEGKTESLQFAFYMNERTAEEKKAARDALFAKDTFDMDCDIYFSGYKKSDEEDDKKSRDYPYIGAYPCQGVISYLKKKGLL